MVIAVGGIPSNVNLNGVSVAFDLAGNSNITSNITDDTAHYVDRLCAILEPGWNLCGATWTAPKNLSVIGAETSATFVSVWNNTHEWATCIVGVSNANCEVKTGVNNDSLASSSLLGHSWVYVESQTRWTDRVWVATQLNANITLTSITNGWNIIPGEYEALV